jgi:hypothetical protein
MTEKDRRHWLSHTDSSGTSIEMVPLGQIEKENFAFARRFDLQQLFFGDHRAASSSERISS